MRRLREEQKLFYLLVLANLIRIQRWHRAKIDAVFWAELHHKALFNEKIQFRRDTQAMQDTVRRIEKD